MGNPLSFAMRPCGKRVAVCVCMWLSVWLSVYSKGERKREREREKEREKERERESEREREHLGHTAAASRFPCQRQGLFSWSMLSAAPLPVTIASQRARVFNLTPHTHSQRTTALESERD